MANFDDVWSGVKELVLLATATKKPASTEQRAGLDSGKKKSPFVGFPVGDPVREGGKMRRRATQKKSMDHDRGVGLLPFPLLLP